MSNVTRALIVASALAVAACTAMQQQKSQPVRTDQGEFKNLKVLPPNISHDELIATMRGFARALGTRCNGCHVAIPGEENKFDFASDAKDEKRTARTMIRMTRNINSSYVSKVKHDEEPGEQHKMQEVTCFTCHRGHMTPEPPPAPAERPSP